MPILKPLGVPSQGNTKVIAVFTMANVAAPKMTEISAAGSLDISGYLHADGWSPARSTNKGNPPRRLYTKQQFEQLGFTTYSLGDSLMYAVDPQGAAGTTPMKAWEALTPGLTCYFVERQGLDADTVDFAIGQFVAVWTAVLGPRLIMPGDAGDEFGEFTVSQAIAVPAQRTERVALVA